MAIRGVFFDLHGTLYLCDDTVAAWAAWEEGFAGCCLEYAYARAAAAVRGLGDGFFARPGPGGRPEGLTPYERRIGDFLREFEGGREAAPAEVHAVADRSVGPWLERWRPDPEALPLLRHLRKSMRTALISNFDHPPPLLERIARDGLSEHLECVVVSGDVGVEKPDPAVFAPALAATGLDPAEVLFVGDSAEDVAGARAAGLGPVLVDRMGNGPPVPPDVRVIRSLAELASG